MVHYIFILYNIALAFLSLSKGIKKNENITQHKRIIYINDQQHQPIIYINDQQHIFIL